MVRPRRAVGAAEWSRSRAGKRRQPKVDRTANIAATGIFDGERESFLRLYLPLHGPPSPRANPWPDTVFNIFSQSWGFLRPTRTKVRDCPALLSSTDIPIHVVYAPCTCGMLLPRRLLSDRGALTLTAVHAPSRTARPPGPPPPPCAAMPASAAPACGAVRCSSASICQGEATAVSKRVVCAARGTAQRARARTSC